MQLTQYVCSQYFRNYHFLPFENNCLQSPVNLGSTSVVWCLRGCSWCCLATRWQRPLWCFSAQDQVPLLQVKLNSQRVNFSFNLFKCLALYQVYAFHHQGGWILKVVEFLHLPLLEVVWKRPCTLWYLRLHIWYWCWSGATAKLVYDCPVHFQSGQCKPLVKCIMKELVRVIKNSGPLVTRMTKLRQKY